MTGLLLKKFSNKVTEQILDEFFRNLTTFEINASTDVANTPSFFITATNVGNNAVFNNDIVRYYTGTGGTILTGLSNGHLYKVSSANSTGFKLANVTTNATMAVVSGSSETHYLAVHNPSYYFAVSKHSPWTDNNTPDTPKDNLQEVYGFQREMILGKRINRSDLAFMIRRVDWQSNTVYTQYDDTDDDLFDQDFYVITDQNNIYKCLDNNNGAPSTAKPTGQLTTRFQSADGYIWKYMYTLSTANNSKFSTADYIPVDANTSISAAAANGSVEVVQITTTGSNYRGYATGFIQQVISNTLFKVETSTTATSNDYYNTSGFYIDSGAGSGQLGVVSDYIVNASGHFIQTVNNIDSPILDTTSVYLISPQVKFYGDGTGLKAYSNVAVAGNTYSISSINILNRGQIYSYCTAEIIANPAYGSGATLRPVLSPDGGHGYNQPAELGASFLCISSDFSNNESTTVSTNPKFRKTGIIYAPKLYANDSLYYSNTTFDALYSMSITLDTLPIIFEEGEIISTTNSTAQAIVAWSNTSYVEYSYTYGTFSSSDRIVGLQSGAEGTIASINTPDINKFTNEVIYYDYVLPIQRSNTTTETAKLLIAI